MPAVRLTDVEARILGSLVEKSHTTPDQYPLSLNALMNACNQKSSRDPVMNLDEATIARAISSLQEKGLIGRRSEPGSRVTKFMHHVENLIGGGTTQEIGTICALLLRGPQTPGEIKTRTDRLCDFESTAQAESILLELAGRTDGPFVTRMARQTGQKEARYRHLFFGEVPGFSAPAPEIQKPIAVPAHKPLPTPPDRFAHLEKRIEVLEAAVRELRSRLKAEAGQ
jgi:uncharacterized protein YceH (UPF0502 family)